MTSHEMLNLLCDSKDETIANISKKILVGEINYDHYKKICSEFMYYVLESDYELALKYANKQNYYALTNKMK